MNTVTIHVGDCLDTLRKMPDASVQCCVTSPPYWGLRDYGHDGQIGLESTPEAYVARMVEVFREVRRVLRDDGTCWVNLGDSYASGEIGRHDRKEGRRADGGDFAEKERGQSRQQIKLRPSVKPKDLVGIPWRVAFALQADGWYLRQDIIWHKPNPMPESVRDRCTKAHEYLFLLSKSERYYYDAGAIAEPLAASSVARLSQPTLDKQAGSARVPGKTNGNMKAVGPRFGGSKYGDDDRDESRTKSGNEWKGGGGANKRSVWTVATRPYKGAHFATFPPALIEPCILAGSRPGDTVLDPFGGSGTTGLVAERLQRNAILCELNPKYVDLARERICEESPLFSRVS
jgi:DNA modification methylase